MRVHFIAIGGSAMHSLALALQRRGDKVTGSDDAIFEPSKSRLADAGLLPDRMGWDANRVTADIDGVVLGMHARENNPELIKAQSLGIQIWSYPEFLYQVTQDKTRVVIGGSHGKTTTTAMLLHVLNHCEVACDYMVGANLPMLDHSVNLTETNEFALFEGDEYLSSPIDSRPKFHLYQANVALLTGMEWDHVNVFPTEASYEQAFADFLLSMTVGGALVYNAEDLPMAQLIEADKSNIKKFPYHTPSYRIDNGQWIWESELGDVPLMFMGRHNLSNAEGARWLALEMGVQEAEFYEAIASFEGAQQRLEKLAEANRVLYLDFAHAPSKVRATVQAYKDQYSDRPIWAVLELHTFSSLNSDYITRYAQSMDGLAEAKVFFDPEAVKHKQLPALGPEQVKAAFGHSVTVYTDAKALREAMDDAPDNAACLMMSSGDMGGWDVREWAPVWCKEA